MLRRANSALLIGAGWLSCVLFNDWHTRGNVRAASSTPPPIEVHNKTAQIRAGEITRYGFPNMNSVHALNDYVLSYDSRNRVPHWVLEHLTRDQLKPQPSKKSFSFTPATWIHSYFQATNNDYNNSGFDRGHLAAAGNHHWSPDGGEDTFILANIAPQVGQGFNQGIWNNMEIYVRNLTTKFRHLYVCTGPLYLPSDEKGKLYVKYQVIGENHVAVPTHFFKVIIGEVNKNEFDLEAFIVPNTPFESKPSLANFHATLDQIERAAGFLIFDRLPKTKIRKINGENATH